MSVEIDLKKNPRPNSGGEETFHPCIADPQTSRMEEAKAFITCSTATEGDVDLVLGAFSRFLEKELLQGHSVHIPGMGTFSVHLTSKEPIRSWEELDSRAIRFSSVAFRPDAELQRRLQRMTFRRVGDYKVRARQRSRPDEWLRQQLDRSLGAAQGCTSVADFQNATGLSPYFARKYLNRCVGEGYLRKGGCAAKMYYYKNE